MYRFTIWQQNDAQITAVCLINSSPAADTAVLLDFLFHRIFKHKQTVHRLPFTVHRLPITEHGARLTAHGQRPTAHPYSCRIAVATTMRPSRSAG